MTVKKPLHEFLEEIAKSPRPQKGWILVSRALTGAEPTMGTAPQNGSDLGLVVLCACCAWASLHSAPLSSAQLDTCSHPAVTELHPRSATSLHSRAHSLGTVPCTSPALPGSAPWLRFERHFLAEPSFSECMLDRCVLSDCAELEHRLSAILTIVEQVHEQEATCMRLICCIVPMCIKCGVLSRCSSSSSRSTTPAPHTLSCLFASLPAWETCAWHHLANRAHLPKNIT